jgi:lactate dehydrogenase-like 2-hydroxyacid dehydrogenase
VFPVSLQNWHIYEVESSPGSWKHWFNGSLAYSTASNTVGFDATGTIGKSAALYYFDGSIAEIVLYDRVLTALEKTAVRYYLNTKWALY